jgi:hypothetical protein
MKISRMIAGLAAGFAFAGAAQASSVVVTQCNGVTDSAGCLFKGNINGVEDATNPNSYLSAQNAYNALTFADITLKYISKSDDADFGDFGSATGLLGTSGTWVLPGYDVAYIAVKASNEFVLYDASVTGFNWSTAGLVNKKGGLQAVSHIAFFGTLSAPPAVPEPATWAMFLMGFGAVGYSLRSRKSDYRFAQAV